MKTHRLAAVLACWSVAVAGCSPVTAIRCALTDLLTEGPGPQPADTRTVAAAAETAPVVDACDAADDPAVWVNEANPEASLIVATNKLRGFVVYGLDGAVVSTREIDAAYVVARCRAAAEEGDVDAQFELGEAYFLGRGVPQDAAAAVAWFRQAAEQGAQLFDERIEAAPAQDLVQVLIERMPAALGQVRSRHPHRLL